MSTATASFVSSTIVSPVAVVAPSTARKASRDNLHKRVPSNPSLRTTTPPGVRPLSLPGGSTSQSSLPLVMVTMAPVRHRKVINWPAALSSSIVPSTTHHSSAPPSPALVSALAHPTISPFVPPVPHRSNSTPTLIRANDVSNAPPIVISGNTSDVVDNYSFRHIDLSHASDVQYICASIHKQQMRYHVQQQQYHTMMSQQKQSSQSNIQQQRGTATAMKSPLSPSSSTPVIVAPQAHAVSIDFSHCNLHLDSIMPLVAFIRDYGVEHASVVSPTTRRPRIQPAAATPLAPLHIARLVLDANSLWCDAFRQVVAAAAGNAFVRVDEVKWNDSHVGALRAAERETKPWQAKSAPVASADGGDGAEKDGTHTEADDESQTAIAVSLVPIPIVPTIAPSSLYPQLAALCYTPLITLLSRSPFAGGLIRLSLAQCGLTELFVAYLSEGMRYSSSIEYLDLDGNSVGDEGAKMIAAALTCGDESIKLDASRRSSMVHVPSATSLVGSPAAAAASASAAKSALTNAKSSTLPAKAPLLTSSVSSSSSTTSSATASTKGSLAGTLKESIEDVVDDADDSSSTIFTSSGVPLPSFSHSASRRNSSLTHLSLRDNHIGYAGLVAIERMVKCHTRMKVLMIADSNRSVHVTAVPIANHHAARHHLSNISGGSVGTSDMLTMMFTRIASHVASNISRSSTQSRLAFVGGMGRRTGMHSCIRNLVIGAREQTGTEIVTRASTDRDRHKANNSDDDVTYVLSDVAQPSSSSNDTSSGVSIQFSAAPHALLLRDALALVWEYVGNE